MRRCNWILPDSQGNGPQGANAGVPRLRDRSCSRAGSKRWVLVGGEERRKEMNARLMS
jgi:hypothetical protein